ncbi:MAG TPA: hypothetical protein VFU15_09245 [Bacteroidia bacterium]|nr:hypothetical protein [Bacteroidia bacterium]
MSRTKLFFPGIWIVLLVFYSCGSPSAPRPHKKNKTQDSAGKHRASVSQKPGLRYAVRLEKGDRTQFDDFFARDGSRIYYSTYKGRISYSDTLKSMQHFLFDLKAEFMVDRIFIYQTDADHYFVVWQETDHEGVKSYMAGFREGAAKPDWKKTARFPNPAKPVIDSTFAYYSMLGIVGKISVVSGKTEWEHDSLFNPYKHMYQEFSPAQVYPDKILFIDRPIAGRRPRPDTLILEPRTGKSIR